MHLPFWYVDINISLPYWKQMKLVVCYVFTPQVTNLSNPTNWLFTITTTVTPLFTMKKKKSDGNTALTWQLCVAGMFMAGILYVIVDKHEPEPARCAEVCRGLAVKTGWVQFIHFLKWVLKDGYYDSRIDIEVLTSVSRQQWNPMHDDMVLKQL